jgi:hypothetical protein
LLTDEHRNDNTQEGMLYLVDGIEILNEYRTRFDDRHERMKAEHDKARRRRLAEEAVAYAKAYDAQLDLVLFQLRDTIRDIDRRLTQARLLPQLKRTFWRLPKGTNPPPLVRGDPRLGTDAKAGVASGEHRPSSSASPRRTARRGPSGT